MLLNSKIYYKAILSIQYGIGIKTDISQCTVALTQNWFQLRLLNPYLEMIIPSLNLKECRLDVYIY